MRRISGSLRQDPGLTNLHPPGSVPVMVESEARPVKKIKRSDFLSLERVRTDSKASELESDYVAKDALGATGARRAQALVATLGQW
jgi:hypothetical protein